MNETLKRTISGVVYILLLLTCVLHSRESLAILFGAFMGIAIYELSKIFKLYFPIIITVALVTYVVLWNKENWMLTRTIITIISALVAIKLIFYLFNANKSTFSTLSQYIICIGYLIFTFTSINYIAMGVNGYNPKILISIFCVIWTNDTFAYLVGKNFGKNKLFPSISPKKTIEGFIGGLIFSIIAGILLAHFFIGTKNLYIWIIISIIISVFSTLGDLIESKFKRVAGIKDSGKIMPGHGGILDRLDSIIFVIPFINLFYLILHYLQHVS